ncbi:hypothetical protein B9Z55_000644 [Caenorhabditis nigoni]|nr:hypothetical protein B9Z55_000644 [Caenorhabditis nigoni]
MHHRRGNRGGYRGNHHHHHHHHQHHASPPKQLYVDTGPDGSGLVPIGYAPQAIMVYQEFIPNEAAEQSGMNGDGWQGPPGGRGGSHHMNGGGGGNRRGGYNNQRMPQQHHGNINRMMPPAFRPQQQPQYMPPYGPPMGGIPGDVLDLSMRMDGMSMASTPTMAPYGDMGPPPPGVQQWNQPTPFAGPPPPQQDDLYGDPMGGGGGGYQPPQHQMQQQPPYGQHRSGGGNNYGNNRMNQNNRGYQPRNQGYIPPMMVQQQNQSYYGNQAHFNPSPFSMASGGGGGSQTPHEHHMGGGGGHNGSYGGSQAGGQMDDYSMWTDENDEEAKRKKLLRDKGLLAWGDADVSNSKPIRRWIVPEGHEEDFETAMERCPNHLKKKALNEESIRRRMTSDNPAVVAQAQMQAEEEANATMKIGKRPIIPTGWGDLPSDIPPAPEKSVDYDQGSSKGGWDDGGFRHPAPVQQQQYQPQQQDDSSLWSNPLSGVFGGPSSSETRNPFFAHHMQQSAQQQQQQHQYGDNGVLLDTGSVWSPVMDGSTMGPPSMIGGNGGNSGGGGAASSSSLPMGMLSMMMMGGGGGNGDIDQLKLAEKLKLAVDKGHLDTSLLSVPHIPPNVLDLLTEILEVIPRLDALEEELDKAARNRPTNSDGEGTSSGGGGGAPPPAGDQATSWMTKDQKTEHDKRVISVVTTKIEVTQLSRKINEKLVECGMLPPSILQQHQPNNMSGNGQGPSGPSDGPSGSGGGGNGGEFNGNGTAPPDHYYDYSFLG